MVEAGAHALAAEAAHVEELDRPRHRRRPAHRRDRRCDRPDRRRREPCRARRRRRLVPAAPDRPALPRDRRRPPPGGRGSAGRRGRALRRQRLRAGAERPAVADHRPQHGRQVDLPAPGCADRALLAQAGSYVPAARARIGIVDRLFSRVGASDNLARGRSTFMVEMVETAAILAQATPSSLVILDEIGRGTSTYDGLAIAWAVVEAMHDQVRCRTLFATHYHELTRLADRLDACRCTMSGRANGRATWSCCTRSPTAPPTAATALPSPSSPACRRGRRRAPSRCSPSWKPGATRPAGSPPGSTICRCSPASRPRRRRPIRWPKRWPRLEPDTLTPREALDALYALKRLAAEG